MTPKDKQMAVDMAENKTFAERRDSKADEHAVMRWASSMRDSTYTEEAESRYDFKKGANFGYRAALEDMGAVIEALDGLYKRHLWNEHLGECICEHHLKACEALAIFDKIKKESGL